MRIKVTLDMEVPIEDRWKEPVPAALHKSIALKAYGAACALASTALGDLAPTEETTSGTVKNPETGETCGTWEIVNPITIAPEPEPTP